MRAPHDLPRPLTVAQLRAAARAGQPVRAVWVPYDPSCGVIDAVGPLLPDERAPEQSYRTPDGGSIDLGKLSDGAPAFAALPEGERGIYPLQAPTDALVRTEIVLAQAHAEKLLEKTRRKRAGRVCVHRHDGEQIAHMLKRYAKALEHVPRDVLFPPKQEVTP